MRLENEKRKNTFVCALSGLVQATKTERNLRFDIIMAVLVIILGVFLKISTAEWLICIILIGMVLSAELMNTAIETIVDMYTREKNDFAKRAKDISAGAVLVIAIISAIVGCLIFIPKILQFIN